LSGEPKREEKRTSAVVNFFVLFLVGPPFFGGEFLVVLNRAKKAEFLPAPKLFDGG
jgi:hypothetical protein